MLESMYLLSTQPGIMLGLDRSEYDHGFFGETGSQRRISSSVAPAKNRRIAYRQAEVRRQKGRSMVSAT